MFEYVNDVKKLLQNEIHRLKKVF